jgi:hypothetical protein
MLAVVGVVRVFRVGHRRWVPVGAFRTITEAYVATGGRLTDASLRMIDAGGILGHRDPGKDWQFVQV